MAPFAGLPLLDSHPLQAQRFGGAASPMYLMHIYGVPIQVIHGEHASCELTEEKHEFIQFSQSIWFLLISKLFGSSASIGEISPTQKEFKS